MSIRPKSIDTALITGASSGIGMHLAHELAHGHACGDFRVVSLMSREAADELGLAPGSRATAVVKATTVIVEA